MEEGRRSGEGSGYLVKNRGVGSGRLIVKKRGHDFNDGSSRGSGGSSKVFGGKMEKKRGRMSLSDSGSSDDLLMPPMRRRVAPETLRVCNGLSHFDRGGGGGEEDDFGRKRVRGESVRSNEVGLMVARSGEDFGERKRKMLDVFEFDEYNGSDEEEIERRPFDDGRRYVGSMREYETGSSRHPVVDRRNNSYLERIHGVNRGDRGDRDRSRPPVPFYGSKYDSDGHIRVQGKNGVLKVMVKKKTKVSGSSDAYASLEMEEKRKGLRSEDTVKRNVLTRPSFYTPPKIAERAGPSVSKLKSGNKLKSSSGKRLPVRNGKIKDEDSEDSGTSLKLGLQSVENVKTRKAPLSTRSLKRQEVQSDDSDTSLKLGPKSSESHKFTKHASSGGEIVPFNELPPAKSKEGKVKRGTGTEKQKLRERIRGMLLNAGWNIDYRPRRNRDYLDAVYINPNGTAYWSIIKAYDALQKQLNDEEEEAKAKGDTSFRPLPEEVLNQLTRKTRKKMEKEMKMKQREANESENARDIVARRSSSSRHDEESNDSGSHEEKLSSFLKQSGSGKSVKSRINGDSSLNLNTKGQGSTRHLHAGMEPSGVDSHLGRRTRKLGRCTLLIRNPNDSINSDTDGYVPYSGKRTVLSWLIDCGTVQLSQKVRYMNRRRTKVLLEGWVTRDGIHCGCCSKILTVLKFEIHAGSKQRQPFQNICLDSGDSLLECQIDAWNRQESVEHIGFHSVDVDGDDPNDDTCGLCGDGGDLICCDNCPSTFHLSCLDIEMLPPGDWHCPHCTCKFCGLASEDIIQGDDTTVNGLLTCSLCEKKYHTSCSQGVDALSIDTDGSVPCFCGKTCKEVFEQLQKYLGVKHELESGLSWSLIRRGDVDLDIPSQGLPNRVECNSKLAVALSVMDECFLPVVDRRSGINLLHNVFYNCGSNFNRLNYSGFYTAILERGDEIISAASLRFHGTQFAEMPFIGTRHIYRRQGMCRRLFCAIESALCSLKVQRMIIPAISELTHTWTGVFGFTNIDRSLKQELKSFNVLVFPGIDMLQKQLLEQENKDVRGMEFEDNQYIAPEAAIRSDIDSSAKHDPDECDDGDLEHANDDNQYVTPDTAIRSDIDSLAKHDPDDCDDGDLEHANTANDDNLYVTPDTAIRSDIDSSAKHDPNECDDGDLKHASRANDEVSTRNSDPHYLDVPSNNTVLSSSLVSSDENKKSAPLEETVHTDFDPVEIRSPCIADKMDNMSASSSAENIVLACIQDDVAPTLDDTLVMNDSFESYNEQKNSASLDRTTIFADMESGSKLAELTPDSECLINADSKDDRQEENKQDLACPIEDNIHVLAAPAEDIIHDLAAPAEDIIHDLAAPAEENIHDLAAPAEDNIHLIAEGGIEDAHELNLNESASDELKMSKSIEETLPVDYQSDDKFVEIAAKGKCPSISDTGNDSGVGEATPVVDHVTEDKATPVVDPVTEDKATPVVDPVTEDKATPVVDPVTEDKATPVVDPIMKDKSQFDKEDADEVYADIPFLEAVPPTKETDADNSTNKANEIGSINGADKNTNFDQKRFQD
ncbi:Acyl-CoA N-acyltransferase with RING/FYVE/PHD-type zinc finger protein [Euphorbia peplus]|nr:Acyl-CoA N-acyltransferase with RING/FYVE/PHD-type zinc finger protein [Euphorbia peplus]